MIRKGKTYLKEQEGIAFLWIFIDGYISYAFLFFFLQTMMNHWKLLLWQKENPSERTFRITTNKRTHKEEEEEEEEEMID